MFPSSVSSSVCISFFALLCSMLDIPGAWYPLSRVCFSFVSFCDLFSSWHVLLSLCCPVLSAHPTRVLSLCVPSLRGHHCCMCCVAMHCVSSHCSSLPPCSEMMLQQMTMIDASFSVHTSHAVCASISTCMCDAIQLGNFVRGGAHSPRWPTRRIPRGHGSALSCLC